MARHSIRYPIPHHPPEYREGTRKMRVGRRFPLFALVDIVVIAITLFLVAWLAALLLKQGSQLNLTGIIYIIVFWAFIAYLGLPRAHQLFSTIYVPDYFIGRTRTGDGLLGDPVNLALDGSEEDIHAAMQRAGWTMADEITLGSSWRIVKSSVFGVSYPSAPVSDLYLFGRRHEFAYQQEVDGNASQRHHVRFWPVPEGWVLPGGHRAQWMAAGSYDTSVGLSAFTLQVTHKIDEYIDLERDYIVNSVRYHDPECGVEVIQDFSTAYHHRNGGGDRVQTDGDMPILDVTGAYDRAPKAVFMPPERPRKRDRILPPIQLLLTAAFITLNALVVAGLWVGLGIDHLPPGVDDANEALSTALILTPLALVQIFLCAATIARKQWARVALMIVLVAMAVVRMIEFTAAGEFEAAALIEATLVVLTVLAITADPVRQWVSRGKAVVEVNI